MVIMTVLFITVGARVGGEAIGYYAGVHHVVFKMHMYFSRGLTIAKGREE